MHSPFKFLDSYTREDRDIYFGRSRETEALYTSVFKSKMVLLYGISGTGKSSLIQCGLANKFQESDWLPVFVRRGTDMLDSLFQSLVQTHIEAPHPPKKRTAKSFLKLLQSLYLDHFKPVYLIFDQFEELFIFGNKEERNEFVQLMEALQESDVQVKVIFSIREEYLAMLTEFEDRLPELFLNRIRVERMHFPQAKEVIQGACRYANIEIEEGFEEQLLEKLTGGKKELELTYLQVLLDRLWKKSGEGKNGFTLTLLESMGHISDLLGQFLEEQINELEAPEQGLTVLKTFVSVQGTKKQLTFEEINQGCLSLGQELDEKTIQDLLHRFTDLRILRDKDESGRYELRHDSLAAKIYEKITLAEKELMEVRQFVEWAYDNYTKRKIPLTLKDLEYITTFEEKLVLPQKLAEFLKEAKQQFAWRKKKQKRLSLWSGIAFWFIIALIVTFAASKLISYFNEQKVLRAMLHMHNSPVQAYEFASEVYEKEKSPEAYKVMMNSFMNILERMDQVDSLKRPNGRAWTDFTIYEHDVDFLQIGRPDSSALIYTIDADSVYALRDSSGKAVYEMKLACIPDHLKISNDGLELIYFSPDSLLWFQNLQEKKLLHDLKGLPYYPLNVFDIAPDGSKVAFTHQDSLWKYQPGMQAPQFLPPEHKTGAVRSLRYSPQHDLLAVGGDSAILVYRMPEDTVFLFRAYKSDQKSIFLDFTRNAYYLYIRPSVWKDNGGYGYLSAIEISFKKDHEFDGVFYNYGMSMDSVLTAKNLDDRYFLITHFLRNDSVGQIGQLLFDSWNGGSNTDFLFVNKNFSRVVNSGKKDFFMVKADNNQWGFYRDNLFINTFDVGEDLVFGQRLNCIFGFRNGDFVSMPIVKEGIEKYLQFDTKELKKLNDFYLY